MDQCRQLLTTSTKNWAELSCRENHSNQNSIRTGKRSGHYGVVAKRGLKSRRFSLPRGARPPSRTCMPFTNGKYRVACLSGSRSLHPPPQHSQRSRWPRRLPLLRRRREDFSSPHLPRQPRQRRSPATTSISDGPFKLPLPKVAKQLGNTNPGRWMRQHLVSDMQPNAPAVVLRRPHHGICQGKRSRAAPI